MNKVGFTYYLTAWLVFAAMAGGCAQVQKAQDQSSLEDHSSWNAISPGIFPAESWMQYKTPEQAGWSAEKLAAAQELSSQAGSAAVMVIYNGAILAQWGETARRFMCHSVRKSLLSALYGIAVYDGDIEMNESLGSIGIDDTTPLTDIEKSATVADLLKARSGVYIPAAYESKGMKDRRPKRGSHEPGDHWYYNNWDFNVLGTIYNNKTSGDVFKSFKTRIADPLQMQDFELRHTYYHLEPQHSRHPAYPFRMSARDLARFGLLFMNEGKWQQDQIIPSDWVEESTVTHSTHSSGGYGYMWWTAARHSPLGKMGVYFASGYGGQTVAVVPKAKLVFVHRANTYEGRRKHVGGTAIQNILLQVLKARIEPPRANPELIPANVSTVDNVGQVLSKAEIARLAGDYVRKNFVVTVREIDGRLEVTSPRWGNYFLNAKSATEFEAEDAQKRVEFVIDAAGKTTAMRIWFRKGKPTELERI